MRILALCLFASLAACGGATPDPQAPAAAEVSVEQAWVRLPAVPGRPGAAYFTLQASGSPMALIDVTSPGVGRIELHDSGMEDGVMRMRALEDRSFPADGVIAFEPGGRHAMLFDISPDLRPGDRLPLTFTFDNAPAVTIEAEVRATGDAPAAH